MKKWHLVTKNGSFEIEAESIRDDGERVSFICDQGTVIGGYQKASIVGYHRMDTAARAEESGPTPGDNGGTGQ